MESKKRIEAVREAIDDACRRGGRAGDVRLVAVSKTRSAEEVRAAQAAGITDFGENYLQEAVAKIEQSQVAANWHFIGAIQSNKTRAIARHFNWIHTIDRLRVAKRLSDAAMHPLDVCIQVNIDAEPQKAGAKPDELAALIDGIKGLAHLRLRGLMTIPHAATSAQDASVRCSFRRTRRLFEELDVEAGPHWDTLSMGMSGDFEIAIDEGATMVRIGTAIFGPRPSTVPAVEGTHRNQGEQ